MTHREFQQAALAHFQVELCNGCSPKGLPCGNAWRRTHACGYPNMRRISKWEPASSMKATFTLLHEIGHLETFRRSMRRCESEYAATVWAIAQCEANGFPVPDDLFYRYQRYIDACWERGIRRGGKLPPKSAFQLFRNA